MSRFVRLGAFIVSASVLGGCANPPPAEDPSQVLPLRTVRLYETGVGYFERTGNVSPSSGTALPVPAAHLDDALKTLVVVSQGGKATVDGLEFESSVTEGMARALAGLPKEANSTLDYKRVLSALKGEEVAVRTQESTYVGRVIDVVEPPAPTVALPQDRDDQGDEGDKKKATPPMRPELMLLLVTQDNEIRQLASTEIESVKPTSPVTESRIGLALNALSTRAPQSRRMVKVVASAQGPVSLGYIAETPLWRTTYRVVLDAKGAKGMLQGWALLHNDTDENWRQVRVQLVNGRPDSFLFPLAAPRYGRRGLVTPDQELSTIPQLLDQTPDAIWGDHADLEYGAGYGSGAGFGAGRGRLGRSHRARPPRVRMGTAAVSGGTSGSDLLSIGNLASGQQATGVESAALFTYTLPRPLDLRAHGSALVPFVQSKVSAKTITWVAGGDAEPRIGVLFTNDTKQTLPPGPIAFFSDGGFAGESGLERLKPNEKRYLQYGVDIDVEADREVKETKRETKRLELDGNLLRQHYVQRDTVTYTIENRSGLPREVHWPLSVVKNAKVEGADEIRFNESRDEVIAVFRVPARKKVLRQVEIVQGLQRTHRVNDLTVDWLEELSAMTSLPQAQRKTVGDAAVKQRKIVGANAELRDNGKAIERVQGDLERLRKHLEALGGDKGAGPANPFVKRILEAEDRLAELRDKAEKLQSELKERRDAVKLALEPLTKNSKP